MRDRKPSAALGLALAVSLVSCSPAVRPAREAHRVKLDGASASKDAGLFAVLKTGKGDIEIRLFDKEAPRTVENFVALATGKKEWTDPKTGQKTARPLYDGTVFFRVLPGFIIQGGDPSGEGWGGPGYTLQGEPHPGLTFDRSGLMAMAGSGPQTSGSQFFITLAPAPWLKNTIFGEVVSGLDVAVEIGAARRAELDPASGRRVDRPLEPPRVERVVIEDRR